MSPTAFALAGFIAWFLVLLSTIGALRVYTSMATGKAPNSFRPDGTDVSPFSVRLVRAHANCYESFPFVGGALLFALATGATAITDALAPLVLAARVAQSSVHLASTGNRAVLLRFVLFGVQVAIAAWWIVRFLLAGAP